MEISLNTPALLFPAISLLMLAFTNRFLALASLIRSLHDRYNKADDKKQLLQQIGNLRLRLRLIRLMQWFGVASLFLCVLSMFAVYRSIPMLAHFLFAGSLISMLLSLFLSLLEIQISTRALELELSDLGDSRAHSSMLQLIKNSFFTKL